MSGPNRPSAKEVFLEGLKADGSPFEYFIFRYRRRLGLLCFFVALLATCVATWPPAGVREEMENTGVQQAHAIGVAFFQYAKDHGGKAPEGKSSTEVFQKLIDGGYVDDPAIFYLPMTGKSKPTGKVLKPENVSWDVTAGARPDDPSNVALVFSTGTKMDYTPGAKIRVPKVSPFGSYGVAEFCSNEATFFVFAQDGQSQIDAEGYDPKGEHYVQLTP